MTKTITISNQAYEYLLSKKGTMSFSQTILSLKKNSIMQYAGCLPDLDEKSIQNVRKQANKDWNRH